MTPGTYVTLGEGTQVDLMLNKGPWLLTMPPTHGD
jgi:hypothetical protein